MNKTTKFDRITQAGEKFFFFSLGMLFLLLIPLWGPIMYLFKGKWWEQDDW